MCRMFYKVFDSNQLAKEYLDKLDVPVHTNNCFSGYKLLYNDDKNIYFGFYAYPDVIKLIRQINRNFRNIKISIVDFKEMEWQSDIGFYKDEYAGTRIYQKPGPERYTYLLFTINFNEGYSSSAKYVLTYVLAQFIRGYCPEYEHSIRTSKITNQYINGVLKAQDSRIYGAWMCLSGDNSCDRNTFNKLDNIELVNKLAERVDRDYNPNVGKFINSLKTEEVNNLDDYE